MALRVAAFLAEGFEETEAVAVIDLLRRAGMSVQLVGFAPREPSGYRWVMGAHGISVKADAGFEEFDPSAFDLLFLPGGNPGTENLRKQAGLEPIFRRHLDDGKWIAAICAAPTILGSWGLLAGRRATCYPGMEGGLGASSIPSVEGVVVDGTVVTSRGLGTSVALGLELVRRLVSTGAAEQMAKAIVTQVPP